MRSRVLKAGLVVVAVVVLARVGLEGTRIVGDLTAPPPTPYLPTAFEGQRVYRAADRALFDGLHGSFLLGGAVTYPEVQPPCASESGTPSRGQGLLPYCYWPSIDGLAISPRTPLDQPNGLMIVARVHVHDPSAAACMPEIRAECEAAIVVEKVVWMNAVAGVEPGGAAGPVGSSRTMGRLSLSTIGRLRVYYACEQF
jgi:hypothetical protein